MARAAEGDEEAFGLLVQRWERSILSFLSRMVGDREDARDLAQDVFLRVYRHAGRYRGRGQFRSWLFRVAGNAARSYLRRRKLLRWVRFDAKEHELTSPAAGQEHQLIRKDLQHLVQAEVLKLPERQREALLLRRYEEMSYDEIAESMKITLPAVESLLQRAMRTLRTRLNRKGVWHDPHDRSRLVARGNAPS